MPLLEVCIGSVTDALAAAAGGADRLELCSALELGGLTPSAGLLASVTEAVDLPVIAMIRPRAGGFDYNAHEFATMLRDAEHLLAAGADGIVFGLLDSCGCIDMACGRELVSAANGRQTAFHKAFDYVPDPREALEQLIEIGVTRVLTSGGLGSAADAAPLLAQLVEQAAGRIEILPGGGVRPDQVARLLRDCGSGQIHVGASMQGIDKSLTQNPTLGLCDLSRLAEGGYRAVDQQLVAEFASRLHQE